MSDSVLFKPIRLSTLEAGRSSPRKLDGAIVWPGWRPPGTAEDHGWTALRAPPPAPTPYTHPSGNARIPLCRVVATSTTKHHKQGGVKQGVRASVLEARSPQARGWQVGSLPGCTGESGPGLTPTAGAGGLLWHSLAWSGIAPSCSSPRPSPLPASSSDLPFVRTPVTEN